MLGFALFLCAKKLATYSVPFAIYSSNYSYGHSTSKFWLYFNLHVWIFVNSIDLSSI